METFRHGRQYITDSIGIIENEISVFFSVKERSPCVTFYSSTVSSLSKIESEERE